MIKNKVNILTIQKNGDFFRFVFKLQEEIVLVEKIYITFDENNNPTNFNLTEYLNHKKECCLEIDDNLEVIEEDVDFLFIVGVNDSIKNLRPNAKYQLNNRYFEYWEDELPPPSWEEIISNMERMQKEVDNKNLN